MAARSYLLYVATCMYRAFFFRR